LELVKFSLSLGQEERFTSLRQAFAAQLHCCFPGKLLGFEDLSLAGGQSLILMRDLKAFM
jgi:hypothetical protein